MKEEVVKGCALIRVSTDKQDIFGGSLDQQKNRLQRWVESQGHFTNVKLEISHWFEERTSGKTSNTKNRATLRDIRKLITAGLVKFVLVEKLDRLSRDPVFNMEFMRLAEKYNCDVYDVDSGGKIDMRERGSRLSFFVKNMTAEDYSLELGEKVSKKMREAMVNNGKSSSTKPTLGLDAHPTKKGIYVINKGEQKIVLDIFKKFVATGSYQETVAYCKAKNYKTKIVSTKERVDSEGELIPSRKIGGKEFSTKLLRELLVSDKIRGWGQFLDDWNQFPNLQDKDGNVKWQYAHKEIIPKEIVEDVDKILMIYIQKKRRQKKRVYLLSGVLMTNDGKTFHGEAAKSGKNIYYHNKKHNIRIDKAELERVVITRLKDYLSDSSIVNKIFKDALKDQSLGLPIIHERIHENRIAINDIEIQLDRFSDAIKKAILSTDDVISVCKLLEEERHKTELSLKKLKKEQDDLKAQKNYITHHFNQQKISEFLDSSMGKIEKKSRSELKTIIQRVFHSIVIDPSDYTKITLRVRSNPDDMAKKKKKGGSETTFLHPENGEKVRLTNKWSG